LLAHELLAKRGSRVEVRLGPAIELEPTDKRDREPTSFTRRLREAVVNVPMAAEIARLPPSACLVEGGPFQVFCARAAQIPRTLREIGRLREITFRAVGEGTGRDLDLDAFDDEYLHLFSWNRERQEIVGAYRLGRTDEIAAARGVKGLYTHRLFRYQREFLDAISPALELGRSFVRVEYQRQHTALLLLWKGICRFISAHPQYRHLFGAVSVSSRYPSSTRALLVRFLEQNHLHADLAMLVKARHEIQMRDSSETDVIGSTAGPMPVLLRQYLKLNARLVGFNVDPEFGDALDALMVVDLAAVDPAILARYFGRADAETFLAHHTAASPSRAA
jgi:putative hemolysin